jgi:hypothetical protein
MRCVQHTSGTGSFDPATFDRRQIETRLLPDCSIAAQHAHAADIFKGIGEARPTKAREHIVLGSACIERRGRGPRIDELDDDRWSGGALCPSILGSPVLALMDHGS